MDSSLLEVIQNLEKDAASLEKKGVFSRISQRYREGSGDFLQTEEERLAYLFTRLPGTFSVALRVLEEAKQRAPHFSPSSFLDVGAGPGTGMWAAFEAFDSLASCTLLEKDEGFIKLGKKLASFSQDPFIREARWKSCDIKSLQEGDVLPHDLVFLSYSIGEIPESSWPSIFQVLWGATKQVLCVVEPGTPQGYRRLMKIRDLLKGLGGNLWAPCPHAFSCPLSKEDWCHFSVRVSRSSLHRKLKQAELGYEDEKYSYLIFAKEPCLPILGRIIRHPMQRTGHVEFLVCQEGGIEKKVSSKKEKDLYKLRKKLSWGDLWE